MTSRVPNRMCRGCPWGPTPDTDTPEQLASEVQRIDALLASDPNAVARFPCHRGGFVDRVLTALDVPARYPNVSCRGAHAQYGDRHVPAHDVVQVASIDRDFERLICEGLVRGPKPAS